jgi:hypothetical protein
MASALAHPLRQRPALSGLRLDETRAVARLPCLAIRIDRRIEPMSRPRSSLHPVPMLRLWMMPWIARDLWVAAGLPPERWLPPS